MNINVKTPVLWQRSKELFWNDEYISLSMLKAHLDVNNDGASRNEKFVQKSLGWLYQILPPNCHILDLGCGPGLYTSKLSEHGFNVVGIDMSSRSIEYAKSKDKVTKYICSDYLNLNYVNEFDVITLIYCDYGALTKSEREVLLNKVYKALKPNGIFIFDVFTINAYNNTSKFSETEEHKTSGFWSKDPYLEIKNNYFFKDEHAIVSQHYIISNEQVKEYLIWDTFYSIDSLTNELNAANFKIDSYYSDVSGERYDDSSETLCVIAKRS